LLTDPGSHIYGSEEHRLLTTAPSHNLMTINGEDQNRRGKTAFKNWSTTHVADYLSSWAGVYKSGAYTREVFFVRTNNDPGAKDYWIVRDIMEGKGTHSIEQRWRFVLNTPVKFDEKNLSTTTQYDKGGNLAILQIDPSRLKMEQTTTDTWEKRGVDGPPAKLPTVIYSANTALPAAVDTVLFPFENKKMPAQIETLETSADGLDSAFKVKQGKIEDLFILQKKAGEKFLDSEKVSFNGERVFVRRIGGKLRSILLVNGSSLTVDGKQIVSRNEAVPWIVISFDASGPKVYDAPKYHWSY
ncbi:MAG: heparinase II/III family protein, partial [Armatimonadota bacterium]|nr:heparinase II/III family protein [Armatimonadota bacterium]